MPLEYSSRAIIGYAEMYRSINKKTVFIEDAKGRIIYERLISQLVGPDAVKRVFPLGGRDAVIKEWKSNRDEHSFIYIIDGDLNLLYQRNLTKNNLVQIDRYCLENLVVSASSVAEVLMDFCGDRLPSDSLNAELTRLISEVAKSFAPLFVLYAIAQMMRVGDSTPGETGMRFFSREGVKQRALRDKIRQLARQLTRQLGLLKFRKARQKVERIVNTARLDTQHLISGKAIFLPIVHKYCEWNFAYVGGREILLNQCSRYSQIDPESRFGRKMLALLE